jgi:O-antigen/teichoic acid export membrane protein
MDNTASVLSPEEQRTVDKSSGKPSLKKRTVTSISWMLASNLSRLALKIAFFAVFARLIGPEEYGVYGAALTILSLSTLISELGVSQALIQKPDVDEDTISSSFYFTTFLGLFVFLVLQLSAPYIAEFFGDIRLTNVLRVLALIVVLRSLSSVSEAMLVKDMRFKLIAVRETTIYLIGNLLVGLPLALLGFNVWALVWINFSCEALRALIIYRASPITRITTYSFGNIRSLLKFGIGVSFTNIVNRIANNADNVIVGHWLGMEALGFYGRAYQLIAMPANMFGDVASTVLFPAFSKIQNSHEKIAGVQLRITRGICTTVLPVSVILALIGPQAIILLLGENWSAAGLPFQILCSVLFFRVGYKITAVVARSTGAIRSLALSQFIFCVLIVVGARLAIPYGISGVALAVSVAIACNYFLLAIIGNRITKTTIREWVGVHVEGCVLSTLVYLAYLLPVAIELTVEVFGDYVFMVQILSTSLCTLAVFSYLAFKWRQAVKDFLYSQAKA